MPAPGRTVTRVAWATMLLNGLTLGVSGWYAGRPVLLLVAALCFACVGLIPVAWRRHEAHFENLEADRKALAGEVRGLHDLLRSRGKSP